MRDQTEFDAVHRAYRLAFEHAATPAVVFDVHGRVVAWNEASLEPAGALARSGALDALATFRDELVAARRARAEVVCGGRVLLVEGRAADGQYLVTFHDATEQRRLDAELRSLRRVESIGHLTTSLVHDFNNLLTPIVCLSSCIEADLRCSRTSREMARDIHSAAERASGLTRQTLRMLRRGPSRVDVLDLNEALVEVKPLVVRVAGADVRVDVHLAPEADAIAVDREGLEHALLNLVANARDAMPTGGRITMSTAGVWFEGDEAVEGSARGRYVALRVTDTGTGMSSDVRERIFERFYTTKSPGEGTGVGLSSVRRFVSECGGCMALQSEPGRGTTFSLYFPIVASATPAQTKAAAGPTRSRRGWERILVVDDEMAVRGAVRAVLEGAGYAVVEAADGDEALAAVRGTSAKVDLVIADVVMPHMDGPELARGLRSIDPSLRVLFTSGHTERALQRHGLAPDDAAILRKAFTPAELLHRVRQTLDEGAGRWTVWLGCG